MNPLLIPQARPELLWAEELFNDDFSAVWQFRSAEREVTLSIVPAHMQMVCPDGQWVLAELHGLNDMWRLGSLLPLPAIINKQQLERQLTWLPLDQQALLQDVWSMLAYIEDEALRAFLLEVLMNDSIMAPFCQSKGSHRHHHDQVGGLLAHSHEVAMTAAMLSTQYQLGNRSAWVAFIGGLLHDIGKIRLYYNQSTGVCVQHESYNFMLLAEPLERLNTRSPRLFEALSACLSIKVGHYTEPYQVANIVRMCDRISADVSNWKRAFVRVPEYYWYAKSPQDDQLYKRLG